MSDLLNQAASVIAGFITLSSRPNEREWGGLAGRGTKVLNELLSAAEVKPAALTWADKPTVPGRYWLSYHPGSTVRMVGYCGDGLYEEGVALHPVSNPDFPRMAWCGPIEAPERPEE